MARMVHCIYLKKEAEGWTFPPYPGELGKRIYDKSARKPSRPLDEAPDDAGQREPAEPGRRSARANTWHGRWSSSSSAVGADKPAGYVAPTK